MVIVQRVVVRWTKKGRAADQARRRSEIPAAFELPTLPEEPLAFHDVLADEAAGYAPVAAVSGQSLPALVAGLRFQEDADRVAVTRRQLWAAFPRDRGPARLFLLDPGERARYWANFRFSGSSTDWYYEQWTVNIAGGPRRADLFLDDRFDRERDDRVSLYGDARKRPTLPRPR
jgi:hypothetical protein